MSHRNRKAELPYKQNKPSLPVADNPELATKMFGGNRFEMIVTAAIRARMIAEGAKPECKDKTHTPIVSAVLEIQEGLITREMLREVWP